MLILEEHLWLLAQRKSWFSIEEALESPQHCLLKCTLAKRAWEAFYHIWQKWGVPNDITLS